MTTREIDEYFLRVYVRAPSRLSSSPPTISWICSLPWLHDSVRAPRTSEQGETTGLMTCATSPDRGVCSCLMSTQRRLRKAQSGRRRRTTCPLPMGFLSGFLMTFVALSVRLGTLVMAWVVHIHNLNGFGEDIHGDGI